ncbi:MAG: hypothetical protein IPK50_22400 [Fibrobacterota bacterium]|nr:MAG: hypothetical protein IPK50_22400 [Fibrobacterota bacterium]
MNLSRPFLALAIALVPALAPAAPTVLPVTWEQRAPSGFDITAASFRGTVYAIGNGDGVTEWKFWASTDTGRTWKQQATNSGKVTGLKSLWIDGEEILFLLASNDSVTESRLVRRDKDGESTVLEGTEPYFWISPILQAGNLLLLRTRKALMRSADGGKTWNAVDSSLFSKHTADLIEPLVLAGSGKRFLAMSSMQRKLLGSSDSGKSWKVISEKFQVPSMRDGGVVDGSGAEFFLPNSNGAPIRMRFQGHAWQQDTLLSGWPRDSMGLGAMTRSIVTLNDTIWATGGKNLLYWKPKESSWQLVKLDLPILGDQVALDVVAGELWLFGAEWTARRSSGAKVVVSPPADCKCNVPRIALAWHQDALFLCGWSGCTVSKDSGKTWEPANRGLEGTYVVELKSTSQGLMAATGYFGLRLWNGIYWQDVGASGIDRDSTSGRYAMITSLTSVEDTLAFSRAWGGEGIWMRKGKQAGWSLIEHGMGNPIAWAQGAYWASGSGNTLETSKSGSVWSILQAPFNGTVHGVDGRLVIAESYGKKLARKQGDAFLVDTLAGSFGSYGSFVAAHPSGAMALTTKGAFLATNSGTYELPFDRASTSYWISGMLLVGNRLFVTHHTGMLSTTLPAPIQVGLTPRDRRSWGIHNLSRGVALDLAKPAHVEFSWYDLSGARRGGIDQVLDAGKHSLVVPANNRGTNIVRVSVDGVLSESRVLVMP